MLMRLFSLLLLAAGSLWAQDSLPVPGPNAPAPHAESQTATDTQPVKKVKPGSIAAADHDPKESSSKDTVIDLHPPDGEADIDSSSEEDNTGVTEFKPWDPHRAMKDIEVGKYYAGEKNYKAAISRYREALEYKPRDGEATFLLAQTLEKIGQKEEALGLYDQYLKIMHNGPSAAEAQKAVDRLRPHVKLPSQNAKDKPSGNNTAENKKKD